MFSRFSEAEGELLGAFDAAVDSESDTMRAKAIDALIELYDAWHAAEPEQGYDAKARDWQAKLEVWQAPAIPRNLRVSVFLRAEL